MEFAPETAAATEPPASAQVPTAAAPPALALAPTAAAPPTSALAPTEPLPVALPVALPVTTLLLRSLYLNRSALLSALQSEDEGGASAAWLIGTFVKLPTEANGEVVMCQIIAIDGQGLERVVHLRGPYERMPDTYLPQRLLGGSGLVTCYPAGLAYLSDEQQLDAANCDQVLQSMEHGWLTLLARDQALELASKLRLLKLRLLKATVAARLADTKAALAKRPPQQARPRHPLPSVPEDRSISTSAQRPPSAEAVAAAAGAAAAAARPVAAARMRRELIGCAHGVAVLFAIGFVKYCGSFAK